MMLHTIQPSLKEFDKVDGYVREFDKTKYLWLFYSDESMIEFLVELDILLC